MKTEHAIALAIAVVFAVWYVTSQRQAAGTAGGPSAQIALTGTAQPEGGFNNLYRPGDAALYFNQLSPQQRQGGNC